jgi:hypothetical protein
MRDWPASTWALEITGKNPPNVERAGEHTDVLPSAITSYWYDSYQGFRMAPESKIRVVSSQRSVFSPEHRYSKT